MKTYTITMGKVASQVPRPDVLPEPGQKLRVVQPFATLAGHVYKRGDELLLIERTAEAPHGRVSSLGNWRVKDTHFTSSWTNIEWAMFDGLLEIA